jgi:protein-tyrosine phosphatase
MGIHNVGPMSVYALHGLAARGVPVEPALRFPQQLREDDLEGADLIIALKESEHRPLLAHGSLHCPDRVKRWDIDDLDRATPENTLAETDQELKSLVRWLSGNGHGPQA